jgi:two-component system chemotaxis response regulator CheB
MKVLMVEDSATVAAYITAILSSEADMQLLPVATTAKDGVRATREHRPDVVLMDMKLPDHDGLWAIEQIMADVPCPIVVLSGYLSSRERDITFESLRAGAVEVLAKPTGLSPQVREAFRVDLVRTLRVMRSAVVVRRRTRTRAEAQPTPTLPRTLTPTSVSDLRGVLIGSSTGGPELLHRILSALPSPYPLPILITQHTLEGFDQSLSDWLTSTGHRVVLGRSDAMPGPGDVFLAPADQHMALSLSGIQLSPCRRGEAITAIDTMMTSAARVWGDRAVGIVLTGMGRDGSAGLQALYERGALTIAQTADTCVVASMPESARAIGAVRHQLPPGEIIGLLINVGALHARPASEATVERERTP